MSDLEEDEASDNEEEDEGFHFDPYDDEVIISYLEPMLQGDPCGDFIVEKNVYGTEPWLLDHTQDRFFKEGEWYYYARRTQVSTKNIGVGKKSKRKIIGDNDGIERGNWHLNKSEDIRHRVTGNIIGTKQTLTFKTSNQKKHKSGDGSSCIPIVPGSDSSWIMTEYTLPKSVRFQELVICKIHEIKKTKKEHHHEASTSTSHHGQSSHSAMDTDGQSLVASSSGNTSSLTSSSVLETAVNRGNIIDLEAGEERNSEQSGFPMNLERQKNLESEQEAKEEEEDIDYFQYLDLRVEEGELVFIDNTATTTDEASTYQQQPPISSQPFHEDGESLGRCENMTSQKENEDRDWDEELVATLWA